MTSVHDGDHGDDGENEDYLDGGIKPLAATDPARIGPYLLLGRLGAGGMGRVYLARSEGGRTVAVKVVHAEHVADPQFRARFRREVDAARRVGERYTAPVLDAAPDEEFPWVATGYVPGLSLEQIVRGHGALPAESVLALADGLLRALRDIHSAGIVHRDLKPSNVMVTVEGPKVIDFGIARAAETSVEALTSTGMVIGSPGFMAPEQIRGEGAVPKSDVFTLGCVLTYAATGRLPFGNGVSNQHAVMYHIVEEEPDLEGVRDERLRALITRLLAKGVAERPAVDDLLAEPDHVPASASWLPAEVVGHLARQSARLLDAEAAPVRLAPVDRGTVDLRPAAAQDPGTAPAAGAKQPKPEAERTKERERRRRWFVSVPLVFVLAGGGGTAMVLQPWSGDSGGGAHASPPSHSATTPPAPVPPPSQTGSPSPQGDKSPRGDGGTGDKKGGNDGRDGADGRDAVDSGAGGTSSGGTTGSTTSSGGGGSSSTGGTDTTAGGSSSTSGSTGASGGGSTGGSGGTSGSTGGSGGGGVVPSAFVGTWEYGETYNANQPATITISSTGAVRLTGIPYVPCPYTAEVVSKANGGSRINISKPQLAGANPGYCYGVLDASYFTLEGSGIQHNVGAAAGDGYYYKRG
ncbi:serine/threonine-protein kinase [Streptomyces sp. NBC_00338]|uniref:serine/threonine-protein kinase n=1 Tax=Streptomyces sp. NBC_00338 TaxID=2975715 RepID=UPI0022582802|nr:serine/threonine-protein kinase [Streptomyces sp. NBC_00338]MCX5140362.1 serine/threonine protein kinase [Streptomyces sp. NBC_00338]